MTSYIAFNDILGLIGPETLTFVLQIGLLFIWSIDIFFFKP